MSYDGVKMGKFTKTALNWIGSFDEIDQNFFEPGFPELYGSKKKGEKFWQQLQSTKAHKKETDS